MGSRSDAKSRGKKRKNLHLKVIYSSSKWLRRKTNEGGTIGKNQLLYKKIIIPQESRVEGKRRRQKDFVFTGGEKVRKKFGGVQPIIPISLGELTEGPERRKTRSKGLPREGGRESHNLKR